MDLNVSPMLAHLFGDPSNLLAWHPHPDVWVLLGIIPLVYAWAITRLGPKHALPGESTVTRRQLAFFAGGVACLWLAADWPVHDVSEAYLLSVHMAQHIVFTLVAPPLLLLGTPAWMVRLTLGSGVVGGALRYLARPLPAVLLFSILVVLTHLPAWVDLALRNEILHLFTHAVLVASALLMWFPVVNRVPGLPMMSPPTAMLYLMAQSIVPAIPGAFIGYAEKPVYGFYARAPRAFSLSALEDQQLAALVMNAGEAAILWGTGLALLWWYVKHEADEGQVLFKGSDLWRELADGTRPTGVAKHRRREQPDR